MSDSLLARRAERACAAAAPLRTGQVTRVVGLNFEVDGVDAAIGDAVAVDAPGGRLHGEVVGLTDAGLVCMPFGDLRGLRAGDRVEAAGRPPEVPVGWGLLGRVVDGLGQPLDDGPPLGDLEHVGVEGEPPHPLRRNRVDTQLRLGVRALDTLLSVGRGQRIGIFAGSGVGKSTTLSMIARGTDADVSVIALIGERGREVREFLENDLGPEGLARSVVVIATSDQPALVRLRAALTATRIAEWFRDQGRDVVLMMDSLTRFCMAQREVGLSAGEPPATRGYPPSVFAMLPKLLERAGASDKGSITGLYTVLVEGDDMNEPIGDAARSILDGHVVLTRRLATAGHYPCIDVLESISRCAGAVTTSEQKGAATELRRLLAAYRDAKDLIEIGAYVAGTNPVVDKAVERKDAVDAFLRQRVDERTEAADDWARLAALAAPGTGLATMAGVAAVKRYSFRLEQVLRVRRIQEDQAKASVVVAQRAASLAAELAEVRLAEYRAQRPAHGAVDHARFVAARTMHQLRADAVDVARDAEALAADVVVLRRAELGQATQRVKGLERLDERRREDYAIELGREVDREADDVTTARVLLRRAGR